MSNRKIVGKRVIAGERSNGEIRYRFVRIKSLKVEINRFYTSGLQLATNLK